MKYIFSTLFLFASALLYVTDMQAQSLQEVSEDNSLDITSLVQNAACQNAAGWQHHSGEKAGTGSSNYAKNVALFNSSDYSGVGIESWTASPVTGTDLIYQDLKLPAGSYELTACVVAQVYVSDTQHGTNNGGISLFMAGAGASTDDSQTECTKNVWQRLTTTFTLQENGTARIGVKAGSGNKNTWISISDVHLYMTALTGSLQKVALNEGYDTYTVSKGTLAEVTLNKYLPSTEYTTLCIPFSLNEELTTQYFADVKTIDSATKEVDKISITTSPATTIEAGKVYVVKAKETATSISSPAALLSVDTPADVTFGSLTLRGTYRVREHILNGYVLNAEGTAFVPATGRERVNGYSGYIIEN